jgi:putative tricarboxylic transport membrane protein
MNKSTLNRFPCFALLALGLVSLNAPALAVDYPTRPIELVTHTQPGGPNNIIGHLIIEVVQKEKILPQPLFLTLKPGSGMASGFSYLFEKKGEDHLLAITSNGLILGTPLRVKLPYTYKSFTPIANLCVDGSVMVVSAKGSLKTINDILTTAAKNPNKLVMGGSSITSNEAMMGRVMQKIKGVQWKFVSFAGEMEAATNVMGGNIHFAFLNPSSVIEHVRAGNLRVVLAASPKRYKAFPDVPTIEEAGLGKPQISYRALIGPPGMPSQAVTTLEAAAKKIVDSAQFKKYMEQSMMQEQFMPAKQLAAFWDEDEKFVRQQLIEGGMLNKDGTIIQK